MKIEGPVNKIEKTDWNAVFYALITVAESPDYENQSFKLKINSLSELIQFLRNFMNAGFLSKKDLEETLDHENYHALVGEKFDIGEGFVVNVTIRNKKPEIDGVSTLFKDNAEPLHVVEMALEPRKGGHLLSLIDLEVAGNMLNNLPSSDRKKELAAIFGEETVRYAKEVLK